MGGQRKAHCKNHCQGCACIAACAQCACACPARVLQASPYKSLAVKVLEFQNKTPVRFRSKPGKQEGKAQHHQQHNITEAKVRLHGCAWVRQAAAYFRPALCSPQMRTASHSAHPPFGPQTPVLWTSTRARPMRYKSRAEQEQEEAEALGRGKK